MLDSGLLNHSAISGRSSFSMTLEIQTSVYMTSASLIASNRS
jgi:hypothetical protein